MAVTLLGVWLRLRLLRAFGVDGLGSVGRPLAESLSRRGVRVALTSACPNDPGAAVSVLSGLHPRQHGCVAANNN